MTKPTRVLVVDDSAFVRKVVTEMLGRSDSLQVVGFARDGEEALDQVERLHPDVVTLDLVMPRMNGVQFLREQNRRRRIPVVVCSIAHQSGEMALEALEEGAVEFVQKPTALATERVYEIAAELIAKVEAAARAVVVAPTNGQHPPAAGRAPAPHVEGVARRERGAGRCDLVVLGISTGGPHALRHLVPRLGRDFPVPIVIVLHMPVGYTEMYAQRLNAISTLEVREAHEGDELRAGVVLVAPAGKHLTVVREGHALRAHLDDRPAGTQHRPSVDVLFRSAAEVVGARVLGVVMTGMGNDGLLGAAHIKAQGGRIVTEAESSCVVYGMPRAVAEASLSDRSATLDQMANAIVEMI
ncbi:MAG TPA: chemotaxis-specific protein-glutamate methyltransferase CheB [Gemmatimonadaceae bacterium]|nr:chemotaxis-specific protein-glutamate methyltransferase CheB [Gemmatimonadaceae bacterium]